MNFKRYFFFLLIVNYFGINFSSAQISVGADLPTLIRSKKQIPFSKEELNKLKATKTVFLYREGDSVHLEDLEKAIKSAWTFTEISLVPHSDFYKLNFENTSILSIGGFETDSKSKNQEGYNISFLYLHLWMYEVNDEGEKVKKSFCRVELNPSFPDYEIIRNTNEGVAFEHVYTAAILKNWNPGFIKVYLQNINKYLNEGEVRRLNLIDHDNEELKKLANETLYLPDYIFEKFDKVFGVKVKNEDDEDQEPERLDSEKILQNYKYKYEIIASEDLSKKILESENPFYFLIYVKSLESKYMTIYNSKTGEIIYSDFTLVSYNVEKSDFKKIYKAIK